MALLARYEAMTTLPKKGGGRHKGMKAFRSGSPEWATQEKPSSYDHVYVHPERHGQPQGNMMHLRGPPGASRGISEGRQPRWSFERCPSLLPPVLDRDRGRIGRSVAGLPPGQYRRPPSSLTQSGTELTSRSEAETSRTARTGSASSCCGTERRKVASPAKRARSAPVFGPAAPPQPRFYHGLQGVIGMQWADATTSAGGAYRGGDGRYLGF
mmetsp:Transcript_96364/g.158912  ORF Transcript_96364/g.158912 Transcript_96364/m.158912 type:complete len:212 (+) Transcript_96364:116-751(+)